MQSVIVYTSPLDAALWESGLLFPIMVSCVVAVSVAVCMLKVSEYIARRTSVSVRHRMRRRIDLAVSVAAALSWAACFWLMV